MSLFTFSTTTIDSSLAPSAASDVAAAAGNRRQFGGGRLSKVRAKFEVAETNSENRRLWDKADALSADGVANPSVRRIMRNRTRYAVRNNGFLKGMSRTIALSIIGPTGPQLKMLEAPSSDDNPDDEYATTQYPDFVAWAQRVKLVTKLRQLIRCTDTSGECFIVQSVDSKGDLTFVLYEPDHVQGVDMGVEPTPEYYDGIHYNRFGEPKAYDVTYSHPGDGAIGFMNPDDYRTIPAEYVYHYYDEDRPGQRRGYPDMAAAIELMEERRRYRHATLAAAETAATFASVIEQDIKVIQDAGGDAGPVDSRDMDEIELNHRMTTILPPGHKLGGFKAEQPTATFAAFDKSLLQEAAASQNLPLILAVLHADNNLASAYLDLQIWWDVVASKRDNLGALLDWILSAWRKWYGYGDEPIARNVTHVWRWPKNGEHADPSKVAKADDTNLRSGATTLPDVYERRGLDWETAGRRQAKALGLTFEEYQQRLGDVLLPRTGSAPQKAGTPTPGATEEDDPENDPATTDPQE